MNLIKPKKLKKGDTIAIIAPCGVVDIEKVKRAKTFFENNGYKVKLGSNISKQERYLAGTDTERLKDLHNAFLDEEINAIICARGGYGAIRLIKNIDYELIKNNPKIFCGYSDITILSAMILKNSGLITFSGPMAQSDFAENEINDFTLNSFMKTLTSNEVIINKTKDLSFRNGDCSGIFFGGNLSSITTLTGHDFIPDEKFIFFAEDLNEPVYKIDRYFTQLLNIDKFRNNITGIVLGDFLDIDDKDYFNDFFIKLSQDLQIPILGKYPISHDIKKATVPYGAAAEIKNETIKIKDYIIE